MSLSLNALAKILLNKTLLRLGKTLKEPFSVSIQTFSARIVTNFNENVVKCRTCWSCKKHCVDQPNWSLVAMETLTKDDFFF